MEEGRTRVGQRYQSALARAREHGYTELASRLERMIEQEAQGHARRQMSRLGIAATAGERVPTQTERSVESAGRGMNYSAPVGGRPSPLSVLGGMPREELTAGEPQAPPPMLPTLSGVENRPQQPIPQQMLPPLPLPPTTGVAAGPQSPQEAGDLAESGRSANLLFELSGMGPLRRSGIAASEGRPLEALGHGGVAMLPYKPVAGLAALGGAYGGALAQTLFPGMFSPSSPATAQQGNQPAPDDGLNPTQRKRREQLLKQLRRQGDDMPVPLQEELKGLNKITTDLQTARNAADVGNQSRATQASQDEYNRAVTDAERARKHWEARDVEWNKTPVGRLNEAMGGYGPMVLGGVAGGLTRSAGRVMGHGDNWRSHYLAPAATGGFVGASAVNAPVIYNAMAPDVLNPRRRALEEELALLPANHPRRAAIEARLADTERLPTLNPIRQDAQNQLSFWPGQPGFAPTMGRTMSGFVWEGAPGGVIGSEIVRRLGNRRTGGTTGGTGGESGGNPPPPPPPLPSLIERRHRANPDDPRGHWVAPGAPARAGETETWVSPQGRNEVFRDAGGNWQRRLPNGRTEFISAPPSNYRRISSAEPNRLAEYAVG